jgi:hypothetical protein
MDSAMDLSFSEPVGFIKAATDVDGLIQSVLDLYIGANLITLLPGLMKFIQMPWIWKYLSPKPIDKTGPGALQGFANAVVKKRLEKGNPTNRRDLLQQLLEYTDQNGKAMTRQELETEALTPVYMLHSSFIPN